MEPSSTADWFARRTHRWCDWTLEDLVRAKDERGATVSLVVPGAQRGRHRRRRGRPGPRGARGHDVAARRDRRHRQRLRRRDVRRGHATPGAVVHRSADIRPDLGSFPGKGEAMWKSLFVTRGDVLVFMDADLVDWDTHFVPGLLGPLLTDDRRSQLVKGFYERPLLDGGIPVGALDAADTSFYEGGRVTELVARPLIALLFPELAGLVQPLAGEWAVRRSAFAQLSVPTGYAVELAALVDLVRRRRYRRRRAGRPRSSRAPPPGAARPRRDGDPDHGRRAPSQRPPRRGRPRRAPPVPPRSRARGAGRACGAASSSARRRSRSSRRRTDDPAAGTTRVRRRRDADDGDRQPHPGLLLRQGRHLGRGRGVRPRRAGRRRGRRDRRHRRHQGSSRRGDRRRRRSSAGSSASSPACARRTPTS